MRKLLIGLLIVALLAIFGIMVISGIEVGNLRVGYGVQEIINKNDELDGDIVKLNKQIETDYAVAKSDLDRSFKKLQSEKENYQKTIAFTTEEDMLAAQQTEEYKLDYLWTNIGLYAKKNNIVMKADLVNGSSGVSNQFNINFTATGEYLSISEFIYAIEKDEKLGFRIEEFTLVPYSETSLQATFIVKNVSIDPTSLSNSASVSTGTVTRNNTGATGTESANGTTGTATTNNGTGNANGTQPASAGTSTSTTGGTTTTTSTTNNAQTTSSGTTSTTSGS